MNYSKILKAIEKNGSQVTISQTANLITCVDFKLMSGRQTAYKLKWKEPVITKAMKIWSKLFKIKLDTKPYLTWDGIRPAFSYDAFENIEDFQEKYSPRYSVDENLNVHFMPHIVINYPRDTTNIFFKTIDEANEVYRLMLDAFSDANLPTLINEEFGEKRIKVLPDKNKEIID